MDIHSRGQNPIIRSPIRSDSDRATLETFQIDVARGSHGPAKGSDEIGGAVRVMARTEHHFLKGTYGAHIGTEATRQRLVTRFGAPMHALSWSLLGTGQR